LTQLQNAISEKHGLEVTLNCRNGELKEAWYFYHIKGSVRNGEYVPAKPGTSSSATVVVEKKREIGRELSSALYFAAGSPSNCPKTGIRYLPKHRGSRS
jgi:hypothetical protein